MATWVGYPRSYTPGRNRPIQYVVIHSTEGGEGPTSAEDGAAYDKRRTDGTSTHLFVDQNSAVREVPDGDRAHAARFHGNEIGVQVELCGTARQTAAQWYDEASAAMLRIAAAEVAAICYAHDLPVRRLSVAEVRAAYYGSTKPKGICGHVDVTAAYPEDGGTHTDPGLAFPWGEFLAMVAAALEQEEGDVADVYYRISSTDPAWDKKTFVSNRIHRRQLRTPGEIQKMATAGATPLTLTDAMRLGVSATETWENFLTAVAGPEFPTLTGGGEHTHAAVTTLGPPTG